MLLHRRDTLRSRSLKDTRMKSGNLWSTTFAKLSESSLELTKISVLGLMRSFHGPYRCVTTFPALEIPETMPGSVHEQSDSGLVPVSRWVESSSHRMKLKYKDELEYTHFHSEPIGVSYGGSAMEEVLDMLAKAAADVQRPNHWQY